MSSFAVRVVRLRSVEPHPNADRLELAVVGDYRSVVPKGRYAAGDLVAYIPEAAQLPPDLIESLGLTGRLAGKDKDRVRAVRLRGVVSQGICCQARPGWIEGQDVTEELRITKFEPQVPQDLRGACYPAGTDRCIRYDIENVKRYPDVLIDGEPVTYTEKLHGTWMQVGVLPPSMAHPEHGTVVISSKGLAESYVAFQPRIDNLYTRAVQQHQLVERICRAFAEELGQDQPVFVLGEVFGRGIQDLHYGADREALGFRIFDVHLGRPSSGAWLGDAELDAATDRLGCERVPVLYRGPHSTERMLEHTCGRESITGTGAHIREGIVIRPTIERRDDLSRLGRVQLKSISDQYLLRKGGTEFT